MTNLSIPEEARRILQGASSTYDEAEVSARATGPWPPAGDNEVLFKGFKVTVADFRYGKYPDTKTLTDGLRIQCLYASIDDDTGEEKDWKGAIAALPPNFRETIQTLTPSGGRNSQKSVQFGIARIKGACQIILGRPASPDFLTDIEEANDLIESGEIIGLVINVTEETWKDRDGKDRIDHTDYVNGTVDMTQAVTDTASVITAATT